MTEVSRAEYRNLKTSSTKKKQRQRLVMGPPGASELLAEDGKPVTLDGIKSVYFFDLETPLLDRASIQLLTETQPDRFVFAFQRPVAKGPLKCAGCDRTVDVPRKSVAGQRLFIRRKPKHGPKGTSEYRPMVPFDGEYFAKNVWPLLSPQMHFYYVSKTRESAAVFRAIHAVHPNSTCLNPAAGSDSESPASRWKAPKISVSSLQELAFPLAVRNAAAILKRQPKPPDSEQKAARIIEPGCAVQVSCFSPEALLQSLKSNGVLKVCDCGSFELLQRRLPQVPASSPDSVNLGQKLSALVAQGHLPTTLAGWQNVLAQLVKVRVKVPPLQVLASLAAGVTPELVSSGPAEELPLNWTNWGIKQLNEIERRLVAAFQQHHSGIFVSPVGSGRTLGLVLAAAKLAAAGEKALLIMATREAAQQAAQWLEGLRLGPLNIALEIGGTAVKRKRTADVIIGTAGRLIDLKQRNMLDINVSVAAFDDVTCQLDQLNTLLPLLPAGVARIIVSSDNSETLRTLLDKLPVTKVGTQAWLPAGITAGRIDVDREDYKLPTLSDLLSLIPGQAIVFCNTRRKIDWLMEQLSGVSCEAHHGDLEQTARDALLKRWVNGETTVLLASEVLSVSIDNPNCELVVCFDCPRSQRSLAQRLARCGRFGRPGRAVVLMTDQDDPELRALLKPLPALT